MLVNFNQNKKSTLPIPFNESVGIETAKCFKNLPTGVEELIIGIAGCSPYLKTLLSIHKSWLQEIILKDEFDILLEIFPYLKQIGFKISEGADSKIIVEAIPSDIRWGDEKRIIKEIIDEFISKRKTYSSYKEALAASFA